MGGRLRGGLCGRLEALIRRLEAIMDPFACLMLHCVPYLGERAIYRVLKAHLPKSIPLENFFQQSRETYEQIYGLHRRSVDNLVHGRHTIQQQARQLLQKIERWGIKIMTPWDQSYPRRLSTGLENSPPLLYLRGDETLLSRPSATVVSSSGTSPYGLGTALAAARTLIVAGFTLVTSHYRDVYNLSHQASLEAGRPSIVVLDRGFLAHFTDHEWSPKSRNLELSVFRPQDSWIEHKSARRDQLIFALSDVVVAVELRPGGKIDRECRHALHQGRRVLLAFEGGSASSFRHLREAGAKTFNPGALPDSLHRLLEEQKDKGEKNLTTP
jgi:predicted Rossmann fold nucleotide-binding protein DprA/Smf involved in DNA uptake